jgi:hypothetical protein
LELRGGIWALWGSGDGLGRLGGRLPDPSRSACGCAGSRAKRTRNQQQRPAAAFGGRLKTGSHQRPAAAFGGRLKTVSHQRPAAAFGGRLKTGSSTVRGTVMIWSSEGTWALWGIGVGWAGWAGGCPILHAPLLSFY